MPAHASTTALDRERQLARSLRTGPFHLALRSAIECRGLSLARLQYRLGQHGVQVAQSTLSYWQQGIRRPERAESLRAVTLLEEILRLPAGSLTVLLGSRRPRGRWLNHVPGSRALAEVMTGSREAVDRLLDEIGSAPGKVKVASLHEFLFLDAEGRLAKSELHHVVRAVSGRTDRLVALYAGDPGCDASRIDVRATVNCQVGRIRRDPDEGLVAAEILFGREVQDGETHAMRYEFLDGTADTPFPGHRRGFPFSGGHYLLFLQFDPARLPARCVYQSSRTNPAPVELPMSPHSAVHVLEDDIQPGVLSLSCEWT
jgi:hypothetical protein